MKRLFAGLADHLVRAAPPQLLEGEAEARQDDDDVVGGRSIRLVEAAERLPIRRHLGHRVFGGQFDNHSSPCVVAEDSDELSEVQHVVEDVVADHHIGSFTTRRNIGPRRPARL
jgi:hypothetical protein